MKDLGELKNLAMDLNLKKVKDSTKPFDAVCDKSPSEMAKFKKLRKKLKKDAAPSVKSTEKFMKEDAKKVDRF